MMGTPAAQYRRDGWLTLPQVWPGEEVTVVLNEVEHLFVRTLTTLGYGIPPRGSRWEEDLHTCLATLFRQHPTQWASTLAMIPFLPTVQRLGTSPVLLQALQQLGLTSPCPCTPPIAYFLSDTLALPGDLHRAPPHQDWRYTQGSLDMVTVWVPLVPVGDYNGAVELITGSHRQGLLPTSGHPHLHRVSDSTLQGRHFVPVKLSPGDAAVFSGFTVHQSGTNKSGTLRWAIAFRYNNLDEPTFIRRGWPNPYSFVPRTELVTPGFPLEKDLDPIFGPE